MGNQTDNLTLALHIVGAQEVVSAIKEVASAGSLVEKVAAGIGVAAGAIAGLGIEALKAAAEHEHLAVKMKAIFGGAQGEAALKWAESLAAGTAGAVYSVDELGSAMLRLRSQGLNPTEFMQPLMETGAALGKDAMESIAGIAARIQQLGTFGGRQVRAFIGTGVDLAKLLREQLGMSVQQVMNLGKEGIKASVFLPALAKGLQAQFGGTIDKWNETFYGAMNRIKTQIGLTMKTIGGQLLPVIMPLLQRVEAFFQDGNNTKVVMLWASWLIAGFKTAWDYAAKIVDVIFGNAKAPEWVSEIVRGMTVVQQTFRLIIGSVEYIVARLAQIGAIVSTGEWDRKFKSIIKSSDAAASANMDAFWSTATTPQGKNGNGWVKSIADKQPGIYEMLLKNLPSFGNKTQTPNLSIPQLKEAASSSDGIAKAVEAVIIGGAERARRGVRGVDLGGAYMPGASRPRVDVHWHIDGQGGSVDKAIAKQAQKAVTDAMVQLSRKGLLNPAH